MANTLPQVVAHRGASSEAPENTLAAVRRAVGCDADHVEVDVQRTRDGALVVVHDTSLARTTDVRRVFPRRAPWLVGDFTLDEIRRLDAGSWFSPDHAGARVPTLEEVVEVLRPTGTGLLLELKAPALHPGLAQDVAVALQAIPGYVDEAVADQRLVVQSFDHAAVAEHKELEPAIPVGVLGNPARHELRALATWADQVNPAHWAVGRAFVETVQRHGLRCQVWTVNRVTAMRRATSFGVDGIITDRPRHLRDVVDSGRVGRPARAR